jgi:hypothetical protein
MRTKHPNDYKHGKNGFVAGNPRWNRHAEEKIAFELDETDELAAAGVQADVDATSVDDDFDDFDIYFDNLFDFDDNVDEFDPMDDECFDYDPIEY